MIVLPEPWQSYLNKIESVTDLFWTYETQHKVYFRQQSPSVWRRLYDRLDNVSQMPGASPLTPVEQFLLRVAANVYEVGWQQDSESPRRSLAERYRASQQMIVRGVPNLNLDSVLSPSATQWLARLCASVGDWSISDDLPLEPQAIGSGYDVRPRYLAALLQLADALFIDRLRQRQRAPLPSDPDERLAAVRFEVAPYVTDMKFVQNALECHLWLYPEDEEMVAPVHAVCEEPIRRWINRYQNSLGKHYGYRVRLADPIWIRNEEHLEPFSIQTQPALVAFLKEFVPTPEPELGFSFADPAILDPIRSSDPSFPSEGPVILDPVKSMNAFNKPRRRRETMDFVLQVRKSDRRIYASSDEGEFDAPLPSDLENRLRVVNGLLHLVAHRQTDDELLRNLGALLYDILLPGDINTAFRATEAVARQRDAVMRIRLTIEPEELRAIPWEFLYRESQDTFIATDPDTTLSHYVNLDMPQGFVRRRSGQLNLLLILAEPSDLAPFDAPAWEQAIRELLAGQNIVIHTAAPTLEGIRSALLHDEPDIVQFVGHGEFWDGRGHVALVSRTGKAELIDDRQFASLFLGARRKLGLVSLIACESGKIEASETFAGVALHMVQKGIPAVVAMQYKVLISSAKTFLVNFYEAVAAYNSVDWAVQWARNSVAVEFTGGSREFAAPTLYMRAKDGQIFST